MIDIFVDANETSQIVETQERETLRLHANKKNKKNYFD